MEQPQSQPTPTNLPTPSNKEEKNWAMLAHLSGLLAFATLIGGIIGPLVLYLIRKDDMTFAADQAKEALNFQITVFLAGIVCAVLFIVLIGFAMMAILGLVDIILIIVAAIRASEGTAYRYPFNLRLIS